MLLVMRNSIFTLRLEQIFITESNVVMTNELKLHKSPVRRLGSSPSTHI